MEGFLKEVTFEPDLRRSNLVKKKQNIVGEDTKLSNVFQRL